MKISEYINENYSSLSRTLSFWYNSKKNKIYRLGNKAHDTMWEIHHKDFNKSWYELMNDGFIRAIAMPYGDQGYNVFFEVNKPYVLKVSDFINYYLIKELKINDIAIQVNFGKNFMINTDLDHLDYDLEKYS